MRWLKSNGKVLEVREVGPVIYALVPIVEQRPLPVINSVFSDNAARARLRALLATRYYRSRKIEDDAPAPAPGLLDDV